MTIQITEQSESFCDKHTPSVQLFTSFENSYEGLKKIRNPLQKRR